MNTSRARRVASRLGGAALALGLLATPAAACPYCALSQGSDTFIYILAFLGIPYVIVGGTWMFMRRMLAAEAAETASGEDAGES